jgi:hypothetical protein
VVNVKGQAGVVDELKGRAMRPSTESGKTRCLVLDHTDTTHNLGLVEDFRWDHLDDGSN